MNKPRILLLDIETAPNLGWVWGKWEQNVIEFEKNWYIMSFAYKWADEKKVHAVSLDQFKGYNKDKSNDWNLCYLLHKKLEEADIVIAHNGDGFDFPKINARLIAHGFKPPQPYKTVDTCKVAKRYFSFDSNKLDELGKYLNVGRKIPTTGFKLWKGCMEGDSKSWALMRKYNAQDVALLERVYLALRPWMDNHPNMGLMMDKPHTCPVCGTAGKLQRRGFSYTRVGRKARYQCTAEECGAWSQGESVKTEIKIR